MKKYLYQKILLIFLAFFLVCQNSVSFVYSEEESNQFIETTEVDNSEIINDTLNELVVQDNPASEQSTDGVLPLEEIEPLQDDEINIQTSPMKMARLLSARQMEPDADNIIRLNNNDDFIDLSNTPANVYQNATIIITRSENLFNLTDTDFMGLGSEEYPFKGSLEVTNGDTSDIYIPVSHSFFNVLDQKATIGVGLYLQAGSDIDGPILAGQYVNTQNSSPASISLKVENLYAETTPYSFSGLIGTMGGGTNLTLSLENRTEGILTLKGDNDLGLFCNTMLENSSLTIQKVTGLNSYTLSSTNGHVGGAVGSMAEGAVFTVAYPFTLSGTLTATGNKKAAGGLVGYFSNAEINLNNSVTISESISGSGFSGGYIGYAEYNSSHTLDLSNYHITSCSLIGGNHAGGLFGVLNLAGNNLFDISNLTISTSHSGSGWQYGGLIGQYSATSLAAELHISNVDVQTNETGSVTSKGGLIGFIADAASDAVLAGTQAAYVNIEKAHTTLNGTATNHGGLVGEMGSSGHFINTAGEITVEGTLNGTVIGGIVGLSHSGVLRLCGVTNLAQMTFTKTGSQTGQILGGRGVQAKDSGTLVYALGLGNGDGISEYGWKLIRPLSAIRVSDTGVYGEVIRLDGVELTETKRTGVYVDPSTNGSQTEILSFYTDKHEVIPCIKITGDIAIHNKREFVLTAIMIQYGNTLANGAFNKYADTGSTLLNRNITLEADIDLTDTGIIGLLRDDGVQKYQGTFNGNHHLINLAIGQTYGSGIANNDEKPGSGQIYNHQSVGLLGVMNGTVSDLVLNGNIAYGTSSGGITAYCGTVAGVSENSTVNNVTVNTRMTDYNGTSVSMTYTGGIFGASLANGIVINLSNDHIHSTIENINGSSDYGLGGYIGLVDSSSTINVTDCEISDATISSENYANARIGGFIARINAAATINMNGFNIERVNITNTATSTSGGLLGYQWNETTFIVKNLKVINSGISTNATFGGLVYQTGGYWKVGDGNSVTGITFRGNNSFRGKSSAGSTAALLISKPQVTSEQSTYVEIMKDGLVIEDNSVSVTVTGGNYFDDLVGKTQYGEAQNAVVSIGLTPSGSLSPVLINTTQLNTWQNRCLVNGTKAYKNGNTRYFYNLDYYREPALNNISTKNLSSEIDSEGDLLCWAIYIDVPANIKKYFATNIGGNVTGTIDLTGVSYYPAKSYLDIGNAEITFDYESINSKEVDSTNKPLNANTLQHYQMQTGLFTYIQITITSNDNYEVRLNVSHLTLKGTFGPYSNQQGGVLLCQSASGGNSSYKTIITLDNIILDGIRCADTTKPLLINTLGSYTTTSVSSLYTTDSYTVDGATKKAASSLIGNVGGTSGTGINIDFSEIGLDTREEVSSSLVYGTYQTIFTTASFIRSFQYVDETSGGSYNFNSYDPYKTFGKEISNTSSGRNNYNENQAGQYCYFDTYGSDDYIYDTEGPGIKNKGLAVRFASGYLPYVGYCEGYNGNNSYHELDINQRAFFIVDGCGTYGHPYKIKTVREGDRILVSAENQMMAIKDILDGNGNGTVLCVNTTVLNSKSESTDLHSNTSTNDVTYIKQAGSWYVCEQVGNHYKKVSDQNAISSSDMMAYVRNAYFEIDEDFSLDLSTFNGIGGGGKESAFSGVIVGKQYANGQYPTITLSSNGKLTRSNEVGGLIRYSQGSVVKNLNIIIDSVSVITPELLQPVAKSATTPSFFGGVIGWAIGGDDIIDNVSVQSRGSGITIVGNNSWLLAVGGYVGYVSSNDCLMGGGVVFRNTSSAGLTSVSYKYDSENPATGVDITAETDGLSPATDRYYWNPYVGRVLEGYVCAEANNCSSMGTNTNKNYKIPKIDTEDKFYIKATEYGKASDYPRADVVQKSVITLDSAQDLWVFSSMINSGVAGKATNDYYQKMKKGVNVGSNNAAIDAYFFGRSRTGTYDSVGTINWSSEDQRDESYAWGGIENPFPTMTYLSTHAYDTDNKSVPAFNAAGYMTIDLGYRSLVIEQGTYDLTDYGNGFRGIGLSYFYDAAVSGTAHFAQKLRMIRLAGSEEINGNNSTVIYNRHIYEYEVEPTKEFFNKNNAFATVQAGLFNTYNQKNDDGVIKNLSIQMEITTNQTVNRTSPGLTNANNQVNTAFGGLAGRTSYNYDNKLTLNNVKILNHSSIDNSYYAGGMFGKIVNYVEHNNPYVFVDCDVSGLTITNVIAGGGYIGQTPRRTEFTHCSASDISITTRDSKYKTYAGGMIGFVQKDNSGSSHAVQLICDGVSVKDLILCTPKTAENSSVVGGVVGDLNVTSESRFSNIVVANMKAVTKGYAGGIAGSMSGNTTYSISNCEVNNSYIVTADAGRVAGGFVGYLSNGSLNAFNVISKDNVVGYLISKNKSNQTIIDTTESSITDGEIINPSLLSINNVGLREANSNNKYWTYQTLVSDSSKSVTSSNIGIWVGNGNNKNIKIVAASRTGDYSAIKSIGQNMTTDSYVIYADYTGQAQTVITDEAVTVGKVNVNPDGGIVFAGKVKLTSDGGCLESELPIASRIIQDTLANDQTKYMKGYYGADANRSLNSLVSGFNSRYGSILKTYKTEEQSALYQGTDFPILVLEMTATDELNSLIRTYISLLTNLNQTAEARYVSMTPVTYEYKAGNWVVSGSQSLIAGDDSMSLKINGGNYDNTKNQITLIDVSFNSPVTSVNEIYHLYIPVLVKKVMDVSFDVLTVNGALGYGSAYHEGNAMLASFGEDFTAQLSYQYSWSKGEWNDAISNGTNLLWSFDKQVNLDDVSVLNRADIRLTLVDMNTHGNQNTFYQANGNLIKNSGQLLFNDFTGYQSVPVCDLLPLVETAGTELKPGTLKKLESDAGATVRRWDSGFQQFVYYGPKDEENDPEGTEYYNVTVNVDCADSEILDVKEIYYLVVNFTEGDGMYNKQISLGTTQLSGAIPSHVQRSGNSIYVIGDFFTLVNMELETMAEQAASNVMTPGTNDYIDVEITTDTIANSLSFSDYVVNRPVYFRYTISMSDNNDLPVRIEASDITINSIMIGSQEIGKTQNLDEVIRGYVIETSANATYITIKALGSDYIGQTVSASVHYSYEDSVSLMNQFPIRTSDGGMQGVKFKAASSMAYEYFSLGSTGMNLSTEESRWYYSEESARARLNYDSYNITSIDGNTSQLGLNGREKDGQSTKLRSRAIFDGTTVSGIERADSSSMRYPTYLEGTLSLYKKTEIDKPNRGIGKTYEVIDIKKLLSGFEISCMDAVVDTSPSSGLGLQDDGTFKFRIALTSEQVNNILSDKILIDINYVILTSGLENDEDEDLQYANYKVNLKTVLKNKMFENLTDEPSDYLIFTDAKVYLGIIGVTDTDDQARD